MSHKTSCLFVDVQHGLANRLRALVSAASIARTAGMHLVVIWRQDHHCDCRIHDVLRYCGPVIEDGTAELIRAQTEQTVNLMAVERDGRRDHTVPDFDPEQDLFVRSAYTLQHEWRDIKQEQAILRGLVPSDVVRDLVDTVRRPNAVAAHIRMGTGPGFDHLSYESSQNWTAAQHRDLIKWRNASHVDRFRKRLETLVEHRKAETIFLAADLPETYADFQRHFGPRLAMLERTRFDRSVAQLQYAMADLILLADAQRLLASTWSSFSDVAQRLAPPGRPVEQSGIDF